MKKSFILSLAVVSFLSADMIDSAFKNAKVGGYLRAGYQNHDISGDKSYKSDSLGGKLHLETAAINGISGGVSFYTTNKINNNDGEGIPFFDSENDSYSILGEAYLQGVFGKTIVKLGRQEIDTPFADTDDVGMIPNTFEAGVLINKDIPDTTIVLAQVQKWAGVDAPKPEEFTKMYNDDSVKTLGLTYEGISDLVLSGWYYDLKSKNDGDLDDISYVEAIYGSKIDTISYEVGLQYAKQSHKNTKDTKISGVSLSVGFEDIGVTIGGAYNKSNDNTASNGFGGGPFFTSSEHLTIVEAGTDGKATVYGLEWDASALGLNGVTIGYSSLNLEADNGVESDEDDFLFSYDIKENLNLTAVYSDVDDKINDEKFTNTRVFVNYRF